MFLNRENNSNLSTQSNQDKNTMTMKRLDKFKFCRNIESKIHTLKRDLHKKNKLHEESLSKMFSYILGEDPVDITTSDLNATKKSFWLFKENTASDENGDGNILEMLSSSIDGDSILKYYKKGLKNSNNLNQTENFSKNDHTSPKLKQFLLKKRSNIHKERAIKIILRKVLEIYFENLLTFFKMCSLTDSKSNRRIIQNKKSPKAKLTSQQFSNKENIPELKHLDSITNKLPNRFKSLSKYLLQEEEIQPSNRPESHQQHSSEEEFKSQSSPNHSAPLSDFQKSFKTHEKENNVSKSTIKFETNNLLTENDHAEKLSSSQRFVTETSENNKKSQEEEVHQNVKSEQGEEKMSSPTNFLKNLNMASSVVILKQSHNPIEDDDVAEKQSENLKPVTVYQKKEEEMFYDTEIIWTVASQLNDILLEHLTKKPRRSMKKLLRENKFRSAPEESALDEILKNEPKRSFLPETSSSMVLKSKMKLSGLESLDMTQIKKKIENERQNAKSNSMSESYLASKLKGLQEDLLSSSIDSKRNNQESSLLHEKILKLADKIKSVKITAAPLQNLMTSEQSENHLETSVVLETLQDNHPLQDITNKFAQSMEFHNVEHLQQTQTIAVELEESNIGNRTTVNVHHQQRKVKKPQHSFVTKLRTFNKLVNALIILSEYKNAFMIICEYSKNKIFQQKEEIIETEEDLVEVEKSPISPTANEFKRLRKEESKNFVFASFSHTLPELTIPLKIGSPERVSEANEPSSPDFSVKQCPSQVSRYTAEGPPKEKPLKAEIFQGILRLEESLLCIIRKFYRTFFDNILREEEIFEDIISNKEQVSEKRMTANSQITNENLLDLSSKQMSQSRKETEEDLQSPYIISRNKNLRPNARKLSEEEMNENDTEELLRYSDFSSLSKQISKDQNVQTQQGLLKNEGDDLEQLVAYILKNPALLEELKAKMGMATTTETNVNEEDQKEWRENLEHTLESTLEKKLEAKLRQLLEEKLVDKRQHLAQSTSVREGTTYPLPRSNKTTSPNRPACFTNLTTPRPAVSTYMNQDLRGSYMDWQENEMDGSMQKFQPLNDLSLREEGENVLTESRGTRFNCLDDVLYIYQSSVQKGSLEEEGTQGTFENFDSKFDPATSDNMASDRHHRQFIKNRYPSNASLDEENSDLLRELQMDTQEDLLGNEKKRTTSGLSRNIHFYYILDHIFTMKKKVILSEIFSKLKDCQPLISMFYSSVSDSQSTFSNLEYTQSRPLITSTFTENDREYRTSPATIQGYSMIQPVNNRRSWILSEYPTAVSMTLHKTKFLRGLLEVCSLWDRKQLKVAFDALHEDAFEKIQAQQEERINRIQLEQRQLYEVMQKMFAFVNILQRNQWKNLKWSLANIASVQKQDNSLKCLILSSKIEELYKKTLRQSLTKIYYDNTKQEKLVSVQRNEASYKLANLLKANLRNFAFQTLKEHAFYLMMRDEKLEKLCYLIEYKRVDLIWHGLVKIASYSQMRKEFMLYSAKLGEVLREIQKSKLKSYFFMLKKRSQAIFIRDFERRTSLKKVLNHKMMKEYERISNSFCIWKTLSMEANRRRFSRSFRDILPQQQPLTKEKLYLANFLYKLFYRKTTEHIHASLINIEARASRVAAINTVTEIFQKYLVEQFKDALSEIKESAILNEKLKTEQEEEEKEQQWIERSIEEKKSQKYVYQEYYQQQMGIREKIEKLESVMENLKKNNLQEGLRMIEFNFISKKNLESLCINLVLKSVLVIKSKGDALKKAFFNKLAHNYRREQKVKKVLKGIVLRKHVKCLSYSFNKFRTRLITLKASKSTLTLMSKNYFMAFEKLSRLSKVRLSDSFNTIQSIFAQRKVHQRSSSTKKSSRGPSLGGPVLTIDLSGKPPSRSTTPRSQVIRWQELKLAHNLESFVKRIQNLWLKIGMNGLIQETQNSQVTLNQGYYIAMNIIDKIVFRHKLVNFLHIKKITENLKEEEEEMSQLAISRLTQRNSWNSFDGMDIEYFKEKEQKISRLRLRKYFTDWRLAYIKLSYHKNILDCAFNRLFGIFLKANLSTLNSAFKLLKEQGSQKSNVIKITLVSNRKNSANSVEPRMSANSPSQNKSRERFTKSPRIVPTHRSKPSLNTTPNSNRQASKRAHSPTSNKRRVESYSINLLADSERKSNNNPSGRRSYNQSVSPAPSSRRQSDYSPGKRDSARFGLAGSNRPSVNKSPGGEKSLSRLSARDSVYSIIGK